MTESMRPRQSRTRSVITLDCGCKIAMRDSPFRPHAKFSCPSNLGHGYNVGWTSATEGDHTYTNRKR